jgi:type I restriction enzyme M protein
VPTIDIRTPIRAVWAEFWHAGIHDTAVIMEQMLYLMFLRRLDEVQARSAALHDARAGPCWSPSREHDQQMRWSSFKDLAGPEMFALFADQVFPRLRCLGGPGSAYAQIMKGARFEIPSAAVLVRVVRLIEALPRPAEAERTCPAYDCLAAGRARLGRRQRYHTPRHIVRLMVDFVAPGPADIVCSPGGGACDFLVAASEYLLQRHPGLLDDLDARNHFHHRMFHAHDADRALLRIGCMSMALHGVINPDIRYTSNVVPDTECAEGRYTVLLAHPSTCHLPVTASPSSIVQAEIRMVARCLSLLKRGGRAAVVVPGHILTGTSAAHLALRRTLMEQRVDGVIGVTGSFLPACPAASTAILLFTRTDCGGSEYIRLHGAPRHVLDVMPDWQDGGAGGPSDAHRIAGTLVHKRHLEDAGHFLASGRHTGECHPASCIRGASRHAIPHDTAVAQDGVRVSS